MNGSTARLWAAAWTPAEVVREQASAEREEKQREDDAPASAGHQGFILGGIAGPLTPGTNRGLAFAMSLNRAAVINRERMTKSP